jgi:hypothetical protein
LPVAWPLDSLTDAELGVAGRAIVVFLRAE